MLDMATSKDDFADKHWIATGVAFGLIMFILMELIYPLIFNNINWSWNLLQRFIIWILVGLVWARLVKWWFFRKD